TAHLLSHGSRPTELSTLSLHDDLPIYGRLEEVAERELALRQRDDPAGRGELGGPDDIHVDDVVQVALGLEVGDQLGELVVGRLRSEEHTSELQSRFDLVCRLLLEKKKK